MSITITEIAVNLNQMCKVKLRDRGRRHWLKHWAAYHIAAPAIPENGEMRLQLWEVMQVFGSEMRNGFENPIETLIRIECE